MQKIRAFIENYKKWKPLEKHVQRIEAHSSNDPVFIVENCKALIESICKTILKEANESVDGSINVNKLVKDALKHLGVLNQNVQIANALVTIAQKMGELRNAFGTVSNQTNKVFATGNGTTKTFSFSFKVFNAAI